MRLIKPLFKISFVIIILFITSYFLGYIFFNGPGTVLKTVAEDDSLKEITINGYKFHCETYGEKENPLLLVIHGGPGGDYRNMLSVKKLSGKYFAVFYDQRGTGLSERINEEYLVFDTAVADIGKIIDYYKPDEKVFIIAHSWGAMMAAKFMTENPESVKKAVFAEPPFLNQAMADTFWKRTNGMRPDFNIHVVGRIIKTYFQSMHIKEPDSAAPKDYFFGNMVLNPYRGHALDGMFCNDDPEKVKVPFWRNGSLAAQTLMESCFDEHGKLLIDFTTGFDSVKTPVLFLTGGCNKITGPDIQREQLKILGNAKLEVIQDCGHYMFFEQPDSCLKIIGGFFD